MKNTTKTIFAVSLAIILGWALTHTVEYTDVDSDVGAGPGAGYEQYSRPSNVNLGHSRRISNPEPTSNLGHSRRISNERSN